MTSHYLGIDLGAESGRVMLGTLSDDGKLTLEELHRFQNGPVPVRDHLYWNSLGLYREIVEGLRSAARRGLDYDGLSVDSWGVDYVLLRGHLPELAPPYCYRDARTEGPFQTLAQRPGRQVIYGETGIQFLVFNTIYQLAAHRQQEPEVLALAEQFLCIGDYFNFLLSGVARAEASLASTTQLYDPRSRSWSDRLIAEVDLPRDVFPDICPSGTLLGPLLPALAEETGLRGARQVIATCSHDTGAAVAAVPMEDRATSAYLSSGTWSLIGKELEAPLITDESREAGFTNEIGYGDSVRFLKNIVGLWIVQECRREWERQGMAYSYGELTRMAEEAEPLRSLIHPNSPPFLTPGGMQRKIADYCRETGQPAPESPGQVVRCVFESLALFYRVTLADLDRLTGSTTQRLHIVGGGSQSDLLNQLTADAIGRPVIAGPTEATAIGNVLIQAIATGRLTGLPQLRQVVRESFGLSTFHPRTDTPLSQQGAERFSVLQA